ncbi:MAG: discoidin domain-containing protein, partial [Ruminococcaceae bacterium]|nr:discoidin domain-containing protein [Oscillospiraceae bacterium]
MKKVLALILSVLMVVSVASFGSFSVAAETTTLIDKGSDWSYTWTANAEETLPEGWSAADYDISGWDVGTAPFGNGYFGDRVTTLDGVAKSLYAYDFEVTDLSDIVVLTMEIRYDENPVIYINGTEVWSANNYHDGAYLTVDLSDKLDTLVEGTNRIALYLENKMGGYCFDMSLTASGAPEAVDAEGNVTIKSASKVGFYDFGAGWNGADLILDGNVNTCSGSGRNQDTEQSWTVTFWANIAVSEIYLQTKGVEDNQTTTHEDGVTFGYYNVYVGDTLVAENVPAISETDGGYTLTLETPVAGTSVKVELTGEWYAENWANLADIAVKGEVAGDAPVEPEGPTAITIAPKFGKWENWVNSPNNPDGMGAEP